MKAVRLVGLVAGSAILAGCVTNTEQLRDRDDFAGSPFTQQLATEYRALSLFEAYEMVDWEDAEYFADKGLASADGQTVQPAALTDFDVPAEYIDELTAARADLVGILDAGARESAPVDAATAQARFDCWIEQSEENFQYDHIAACRDEFYEMLAKLGGAGDPDVYFIFFNFDSSRLTAAGQEIIDSVVADYQNENVTTVSVEGHADRVGSSAYNVSLSQRRANAVRSALISAGIPASAIDTSAAGESEPLVPTPDGVREPSNRRAEIRFID